MGRYSALKSLCQKAIEKQQNMVLWMKSPTNHTVHGTDQHLHMLLQAGMGRMNYLNMILLTNPQRSTESQSEVSERHCIRMLGMSDCKISRLRYMMVYLVLVQTSWLGYLVSLGARRDRWGIDGVGDGIVGRDAVRGDGAGIVVES